MEETVSLSELLRTGTADVHRDAERSAFVSRFVEGRLDRLVFSRHLRALHDVYEALEGALDRTWDDPRIASFHLPALWRRAAIATDLAFFRGPGWRSEQPVPAAAEYAAHLRAVEASQPIRLISHAYVRYLGDLSGGQMLKKLAARQLGLDGHGLAFYEFPEIADAAAFKADFRRRLDALALAAGESDALLAEARAAFALNAAIFEQLT
jgi:heme oxygenase (biliverdin-producing, ferredoxin)